MIEETVYTPQTPTGTRLSFSFNSKEECELAELMYHALIDNGDSCNNQDLVDVDSIPHYVKFIKQYKNRINDMMSLYED